MRLLRVSPLAAIVAALAAVASAQQDDARDANRLGELLALRSGAVVADIGAGTGTLARQIAALTQPGGVVFATEQGSARVAALRTTLANPADTFRVVEGEPGHARLPAGCCDAVYMRHVYHHLGAPEAFMATVRQALRPGGRLVVADFEPRSGHTAPPGRRDGGADHGVDAEAVIRELRTAGFANVRQVAWPSQGYFAVVADTQEQWAGGHRAEGRVYQFCDAVQRFDCPVRTTR